ncbi:hypothetical protein CHU95_11115 [Niveispirillum lacus]|uniref:Uncharacterized protein n=1 Tax=Niveispirillum lacus TaxID=1981099 RepID=A0A255YZB5_9PROT|nr:hypothetical protein CHU95_11115 [Niveispirillum lacus]
MGSNDVLCFYLTDYKSVALSCQKGRRQGNRGTVEGNHAAIPVFVIKGTAGRIIREYVCGEAEVPRRLRAAP